MANIVISHRSLFRPESLRGRELAWQGRPALVLGFPALFVSLASVALALAAAALITFGNYARRVDMEGTILPSAGLIAISSPSSGRIEALAVREGEAVEKGTPLYTLNLDTTTKDGETQQQIINTQTAAREMLTHEIERKTRMSEETQRELRQKIENLRAQIDQLGGQVTAQEGFVQRLSRQYNLFLALLERRQASMNEADARQRDWMQSVSRLQDLESSKLRLQGQLGDARYQLATIATTTNDEIDALKAKILEIDEKLAGSRARRAIEIRAPEAGVVTAIVGYAGQVVGTGSPMLKIVPKHANMRAELLAPSSAIGFIYEGERVRLRYSAFPYQKFGEYSGTVISVSRAALKPDEVESLLAAAPAKKITPFYRIVVNPESQYVTINGEEHTLPASMHVQAYALLDRRPLYQWILEPLYNVGRAAHRL